MKIAEIRALGSEEINKQLDAAHRQLLELRMKLFTKQLVNHRELPRLKRDIARYQTALREREMGIR